MWEKKRVQWEGCGGENGQIDVTVSHLSAGGGVCFAKYTMMNITCVHVIFFYFY